MESAFGTVYDDLNAVSHTAVHTELGVPTGSLTWLCCVGLASLGSDTVVPAGIGILDEAPQVMEELGEGQLAGLVDGVVEQGGAPQCRVFPEQNAVDAGQALLGGVQGLQVVLLPAHAGAPWLMAVIDAAEVMCACGTEPKM